MKEYRIMHLEDSPDDIIHVKSVLEKSGLQFEYFRANSVDDFKKGLSEFKPDVILCDHDTPYFDSVMAYDIYATVLPASAFILVTDTVSEEYAVEMMHKGIDDYLLKANLQRLPQAIVNACLKRENDEKMRLAERQKECDLSNLEALINNTHDLIWSVDNDFNLITFNRAFYNACIIRSGRPVFKGQTALGSGFTPEHLSRWQKLYERALQGETFTEIEFSREPYQLWLELSFYPIYEKGSIIGTACFSRNITNSKLAQEKLKRQYDALSDISSMQSHQVMGPVASILGLINLFNFDDANDPVNIEVVENLRTATTKFAAVVSSIIKKTNDIEMMKPR